MIRAHTAQAVREAEAPLLESGEPLMARAAGALAERVADRLRVTDRDRSVAADRVLVLAGAGANGGDGLHAAALLRGEGIAADAIATADRLHEEGTAALRAAGGTITALADTAPGMLEQQLATTTVVLDAMLGLGGRPEVPAALTPLLAVVRASGVPVIAVDLPSFVDATTGQAAPEALVARETVTFGAYKAGLVLPGGAERSGAIHLVDIGLAPHLRAAPTVCRLEDADVRALFPHPDRDASKYTRGVVALAAGSEQFPGAAVLAVSGAARAGAGMVRALAPQAVLDLVLRERPESVGHRIERADGGPHAIDLAAVGRTDALVVGPGLAPQDARARGGVELLRSDRTGEHAPDRTVIDHAGIARGVIDAGALSVLTAAHRFGPGVVLTPHRGEAERLAESLEVDPELPGVQLAPALASATGATVLLKGAVTLIAPGDGGPLRAQDEGTAQLATAGTGDVLAGVLGALLAAGLNGPDAAALAAILHGRAGRLASHDGLHPIVALDVAAHLPETIGTILAGAQP
ncbi:MAG: NAD(P)H-hydrate dehydratase [Brachybacterium sp.]|nr:NAD(P)H-hydrate dehydratase [Brachybacterium sp.]